MELILAAFSINTLIPLLVWIVVLAVIFWVVWWFLSYIALPEPFNKIARVLVALVAVVILIRFLMQFAEKL